MPFELRDASQYQLDLNQNWEDKVKLIFSVYEGAGHIVIQETGRNFPVISMYHSDAINYIQGLFQSYSTIMVNYEGSSLKRSIHNLTPICETNWDQVPDFNQSTLFLETIIQLKRYLQSLSKTNSQTLCETQLNEADTKSFVKELVKRQLPDLQVTRYAQIPFQLLNEYLGFQLVVNGRLLTIVDGDFTDKIYWQYDIDEGYYHITGLGLQEHPKFE